MASAGAGAGGAAAAAAAVVPKDRAELLARAWTDAADPYLQQLVPRFDPWLQSALRELRQASLPPGPLVVPCCGPGHELVLLHRLYGGRRAVYGLDLSPGMVDLARQAIGAHLRSAIRPLAGGAAAAAGGRGVDGLPPAGVASAAAPQAAAPEAAAQVPQMQQQQQPQAMGDDDDTEGQEEGDVVAGRAAAAPLEAHVADASRLDGYCPAAAVLSVFGLQQMGPGAPQALASWVRCLAPGGVAVVVLWPSGADPGGPWAAFDQAVAERAAEVAGKPPPPPDAAAAAAAPAEWEARLTEAALRDVEGAELLVDRLEQHSMMWDSAEHLWQVMTYGGPWRARRLAQGDVVMADLEARFQAKMAAAERQASGGSGSGSGTAGPEQQPQQPQQPRPLEQRPYARVIVIRRSGNAAGCGSGSGGEAAGGGPQPPGQRAAAPGDAAPRARGPRGQSAL